LSVTLQMNTLEHFSKASLTILGPCKAFYYHPYFLHVVSQCVSPSQWNSLPITKTLPYYDTAIKSFMIHVPSRILASQTKSIPKTWAIER
jgi:hypothetical protein